MEAKKQKDKETAGLSFLLVFSHLYLPLQDGFCPHFAVHMPIISRKSLRHNPKWTLLISQAKINLIKYNYCIHFI